MPVSDPSDRPDDRKSFRDLSLDKRRRQAKYRRDMEVREAIRQCATALDRNTHTGLYTTAALCRDILVPALLDGTTTLEEYHADLDGSYGWDWENLQLFLANPDRWVNASLNEQPPDSTSNLLNTAMGVESAHTMTLDVIFGAFESLEAIAQKEGIIEGDLESTATAIGFGTQLGEHLSGYEVNFGDPVKIISRDSGLPKSLFIGGTGQGKSTGVDMDAEDRYNAGWKIIDVADFSQGENYVYDCVQGQEALRDARERMGLAPDFTEDDDIKDPELEILVPMTPDLDEEQLAFNCETEDFDVTPFTVPAADLSEELLTSLIAAKLSDKEKSTIRSAYKELDRKEMDWCLGDLAQLVREREEIGSDATQAAIQAIEDLQHEGFVRDNQSPHNIDWREIFHDNETITAFSYQYMDSFASKLLACGYVFQSILELREEESGFPDLALVVRELWKLAPHSKRTRNDDRSKAMQATLASILETFLRENRHHQVEFIADTQKPSDLKKSVREMFSRYVIYSADKNTMRNIFSWTSNDKWEVAYRTLTQESGVATVVGQVDPAVKHAEIEFVGPVRWSPPSFHHYDVDEDMGGDRTRAQRLDHVELRVPAEDDDCVWRDDTDVPEYLIDALEDDREDDDRPKSAMGRFVDDCLEWTGDAQTWTWTADVRDAYNGYVRENESAPTNLDPATFGTRFNPAAETVFEVDDIKNRERMVDGDKANAYLCVVLTDKGQEMLDAWRQDHPDDE